MEFWLLLCRNRPVVLALLLVLPAPASFAASCPASRPTNLEDLAKPLLVKGEYETTANWRARAEKFLPQTITVMRPIGPLLTSFDADRGELIFDGGGVFTDPDLQYGYQAIFPSQQNHTGPSYVGQNAMAVKKEISTGATERTGIFWKPLESVVYGSYHRQPIKLAMAPKDAQGVRANLAFLIQGRPAAPYYLEQTSRSKPTIDNPQDWTTSESGLVIKPSCAEIIDRRNGKVLGVVDVLHWRLLSR
jgi:hypothetical protein